MDDGRVSSLIELSNSSFRMASSHLLSLPSELLSEVSLSLDSQSLCSFSSCCKDTHAASELALRKHHSLLRKFSRLTFSPTIHGSQENPNGEHPLSFLQKFLQKPDIAYYPREVRIRSYMIQEEADCDQDTTVSTWRSDLIGLATKSPWFDDDWSCQCLDHALDKTSSAAGYDFLIRLIITLLPNLQSFTIVYMDCRDRDLQRLIEAIATANKNPDSPHHRKALARLRMLKLESCGAAPRINLDMLQVFAQLPSMRVLSGQMIYIVCLQSQYEVHDSLFPMSSVEEVKMENSVVSGWGFADLLEPIRALKRFTYHHTGRSQSYEEYQIGHIISLLQACANETLEDLDVTAEREDLFYWSDIDQSPRDLRAFRSLKTLRVDDVIIEKMPSLASSKEEHQEPSISSSGPLVKNLPRSIQELTLRRHLASEKFLDLFTDLAEKKGAYVPDLRRICIEGATQLTWDFLHEYEEAGIHITGSELYML